MVTVMSEIEQFKLDDHILRQAEAQLNGKNDSGIMLLPEELHQLKSHHATTNLVALNTKLAAIANELDTVHIRLDTLNIPDTERPEDLYVLPPGHGRREFQVNTK